MQAILKDFSSQGSKVAMAKVGNFLEDGEKILNASCI
jgi:hypothetical protein